MNFKRTIMLLGLTLIFARQDQGEILDWPIELQTSEDLGLEGPIRLWVPLYYQTELGG